MTLRIRSLAILVVLASTAAPAAAADPALRVGMIPDAGATQVSIEEKAPLRDYLEKVVGQHVELIIPTNYNATVEALGNGSLDFAYLGGLTYVKAHERYNVTPLVQRESDREFHSLFITAAASPIKSLADLKGKAFAFGDINSTSGHLMPYAALKAAGLVPGSDFSFRYTGSHPATAKAVEAGTADAGALDESVYNAMLQRSARPRQGSHLPHDAALHRLCLGCARRHRRGSAREICRRLPDPHRGSRRQGPRDPSRRTFPARQRRRV